MQRENQVHFPRSRLFRGGKNFRANPRGNFKKNENFWLEKNKKKPIVVSVEGGTRPPRSLERKTNLPCHVRALNSRPCTVINKKRSLYFCFVRQAFAVRRHESI